MNLIELVSGITPNHNQVEYQNRNNKFILLNSLLQQKDFASTLIQLEEDIQLLVISSHTGIYVFGTVYFNLLGMKVKNSSTYTFYRESFAGYEIDEIKLKTLIDRTNFEEAQFKFYLFGTTSNLGHYLWNECTAIDVLHRTGILKNFEYIAIGEYDYLGISKQLSGMGYKVLNLNKSKQQRHLRKGAPVKFGDIYVTQYTRNLLTEGFYKKRKVDKMRILIQIRLHDRAWSISPHQLAQFLNRVNHLFPNSDFVIDGFSRNNKSLKNDISIIIAELRFYLQLKLQLKNAKACSTIGKSMKYKLMKLSQCTFAIGPIGSGGVLANWILNIPYITFGHPSYYEWTQQDNYKFNIKEKSPVWYLPISFLKVAENGAVAVEMDLLQEFISKIFKGDVYGN